MESAIEALKKIPLALNNLGIPEYQIQKMNNYILNLVLVVLNDTEFRKRLETDLAGVIKEITEL